MITVIIPALNEEKTIGQVVRLAKNSADVTEVIVVDDKRTSLQVRHIARHTNTNLAKEPALFPHFLDTPNFSGHIRYSKTLERKANVQHGSLLHNINFQ